MTEQELIEIRARAQVVLRNTEKHNFRQYVNRARKGFMWFRHAQIMANVLEKVASGKISNAMFLMPPRHGKTELVGRLFAGYYLHKYPSRWVGLTSYSDEMAQKIARATRRNYEHAGGTILRGGMKEWETTDDGGMWAAGAGGTITGKGAHLIIIDDIFKSLDEAYSEAIRSKRIEWYTSTLYDRREPGAVEIIVNTRWHMRDLVGALFEEEAVYPRHWHIVCMEALKEAVPLKIPDTCTLEPDFRETGDPLCPERFTAEDLQEARGVQKKFFATKFQQRPTLEEGEVWKRKWFEGKLVRLENLWTEGSAVEFKPGMTRISRVAYDWDLAYTDLEKNSASAYVRAGIDSEGNVYIVDCDFRWLEFPELVSWMVSVGGPHYVEKKATGKSAVQVLKRSNLAAEEVEVSGPDKVSRAVLATPAAESGKVYVVSSIAEKLLDDPRQGILNFPSGSGDDLNDAFVQAVNRLFGGVAPAVRSSEGKINLLEHFQSPRRRSIYDAD